MLSLSRQLHKKTPCEGGTMSNGYCCEQPGHPNPNRLRLNRAGARNQSNPNECTWDVCQKACKVAPATAVPNSLTVEYRAGKLGPLGPKLHNTGKWTAPQMVTVREPFWAPKQGIYPVCGGKGRSPLAKYLFCLEERCVEGRVQQWRHRHDAQSSAGVFPYSIWHLSQNRNTHGESTLIRKQCDYAWEAFHTPRAGFTLW